MVSGLNKETVHVPSLYPPLRIAIMCYYLFRGHRNCGGRHRRWGKPKEKAPQKRYELVLHW